MRTLIVQSSYKEMLGYECSMFPMALPYVSSALKVAGFDVECLNLSYERSPYEALERRVRTGDFDVLATSGLSAEYPVVKRMLQAARRGRPDIVTVVGGGLVTSQPELVMAHLPIDIAVLGEGEVTAVELWRELDRQGDLGRVAGIACRRGTELVFTPEREVVDDLGRIAWPDYEAFGFSRYLDEFRHHPLSSFTSHRDDVRPVQMLASRSCPFDCTFCYHPLGRRYRVRPLDDFFAELERLIDTYGVNTVHMFDDLLTLDRNRLLEFCERIGQYHVHWVSQARGDSCLDEATVTAMRESGCVLFAFGIESASDVVLRSMNKKERFCQIESAMKRVKDAGIAVGGNFIFGDVAETLDIARETYAWWKRNPQYHIILGFITCYPGTALFQRAIETGRMNDQLAFLEAGCPPVNVSPMTDEEFRLLSEMIFGYKDDYDRFPDLLGIAAVSEPGWKDFHALELRCPACGLCSTYGRVEIPEADRYRPGHFVSAACRHCGHPLHLRYPHFLQQLRRVSTTLTHLVEGKTWACLGASVILRSLLRTHSTIPGLSPCYLFDNDPRKAGTLWEGVEVSRPTAETVRACDVIVITAARHKDELLAQIRRLGGEKAEILVIDHDLVTGLKLYALLV